MGVSDPLTGVPVLDHGDQCVRVGVGVAGELGGSVLQIRMDRQ